MTVECPTCGDEFNDKGGMRYHHARVHGESIAGDLITCDNCGTEKRRNPAKINEDGPVYCGMDCKQEAERIDIPKGKIYELYWGEEKTGYEIADTLDCSATTIHRNMREYGIPRVGNAKNHAAWLFRMKSYDWKYEQYVRQRKSTYTIAEENDVQQEWVRKHFHEIGIPLRNQRWPEDRETSRESYDYGPDWREIRSRILEEYNHTCQSCGEEDVRLEVHHIHPFRTFENREDANQESNLVPLCRPCHVKWDGIPVKPLLVE